jgi:hypothetical protein
LREEINDLVVKYLEEKLKTADAIKVPDMTHEMAQSIIDVIMEREEINQAPLLTPTISSLGELYLERRGAS